MIATNMVNFFKQIGTSKSSLKNTETQVLLSGLIEAMTLEGSYQMKKPCYAKDLVNPTNDPTCLHGSPWHNLHTQIMMGGELPGKNTTIQNDDNFHQV